MSSNSGATGFLTFGGGGESRTPVRERSAQGLYRFSLRTGFRLWTCPQTGVRRLSFRALLARVPAGTDARQPDALAPPRRIGRRPLRRDGLCRQGALPLTQRRRIRNRCWQLLCCRFLRGQRRLDLQPRLPASPSKPMRPQIGRLFMARKAALPVESASGVNIL